MNSNEQKFVDMMLPSLEEKLRFQCIHYLGQLPEYSEIVVKEDVIYPGSDIVVFKQGNYVKRHLKLEDNGPVLDVMWINKSNAHWTSTNEFPTYWNDSRIVIPEVK